MKTRNSSLHKAFSLAEIVVTVAIIGVLASIAIPVYSGVTERSRRAVAVDHLESMNRAVANFAHTCWKLPTAAVDGDTADEFLALRSLQWQFPASALKPGSPYFDPKYDPAASSSTTEYRIRWNGRGFELLDKGQAGTGLRFNAGKDFKATPYSFPSGYKPDGA
jgi:prepilin-type N-terminal cleavage/methylation domain-containing protein